MQIPTPRFRKLLPTVLTGHIAHQEKQNRKPGNKVPGKMFEV
jgi:hypothetical protein